MVVVTGAGSGIGWARATAFSLEGTRVVAADLNGTTAEETADGLENAFAARVDVSEAASVASLISDTQAHQGRLDILCNNASIGSSKLTIPKVSTQFGTGGKHQLASARASVNWLW